MKKIFLTIILLSVLICTTAHCEEQVDTLSYAVFPYLPDAEILSPDSDQWYSSSALLEKAQFSNDIGKTQYKQGDVS